MSKRDKRGAPATSNSTGGKRASGKNLPAEKKSANGKKNVAKNSTILFWVTGIALLAIFLGRWIYAINVGYFGSFVERDASITTAVGNMTGLDYTDDEAEALLPLQRDWDLFTASRLCDEVTVTADDGAVLHGYLYDEGSDTTVVVLPRFDQDGTADFLPGPWLNEETGCNLLLPDPRNHGESGGEYFGYGYLEQHDLVCWLDWADEALGEQTFILWGEGTGANTALFAEAGGLLPESVAFIVAESPYTSVHEMASENIWGWYGVPAFPFLYTIEWTLGFSDAGYSIGDTDLGAVLDESEAGTPVLFLLSDGDEYILPEWTRSVHDRYSGPKELISGGGTHGTVYGAEADEIQALLAQWWEGK